MNAEKGKFYQHRYGGVYRVDHAYSVSTIDKSEWVVYTHLWPFESQSWHRPKVEWEDGRFRELDGKALTELLCRPKKEFQDEISAKKLVAKKEEGK